MSRSRSIRRLKVISLFLALSTFGCEKEVEEAKFDELVDFTRAEIERQKVPGAAIAVVVDGKLKFKAGLGTKQQGADDPVHADTVFGLGSVTKMQVAAGVLTLRDQGQLDLDAPVTNYVPYFQLAGADAPRSSSVRMRQILSHSAGLPDVNIPFVCDESLSGWFHNESHRMPLWYHPGKLYDYANIDYSLAALVLEEVSGRPFVEAMQDRVFDPAGMHSATFSPQLAMERDHSLGHTADALGNLTPIELDSIDCPILAPPGALYASAPDVARFAQALLARGEPILLPASVEAMEGRQVETHSFPGEAYGFGLFSFEANGTRFLSHGGGDGRFRTMVVLVPERRFAVVSLLNSGIGLPGPIVQKALELFLDIDSSSPPADWHTPPSEWTKYTGHYAESYEPHAIGRLAVTLENEQLWVEAVDLLPGTPLKLTQQAQDAFRLDDPSISDTPFFNMELTFWFEEDPAAAKYLVTRAGVATRTQ